MGDKRAYDTVASKTCLNNNAKDRNIATKKLKVIKNQRTEN